MIGFKPRTYSNDKVWRCLGLPWPLLVYDLDSCLLLNLKGVMQMQFQDLIPTSHLIVTFKSLLYRNPKIISDYCLLICNVKLNKN